MSEIFGGMTGKAEKELRERKRKLDRMEEDATKVQRPETPDEMFDRRYPWQEDIT
jgi:hypothetical protein